MFLLLLAGLIVFSVSACSKKGKKGEAPSEGTAAEQATQPGGDSVTMLDHIKAVNLLMCEKLASGEAGKTPGECADELNKFADLNPQNKTTLLSAEKAKACLDELAAVAGSEILVKSTQGACALEAMQAK